MQNYNTKKLLKKKLTKCKQNIIGYKRKIKHKEIKIELGKKKDAVEKENHIKSKKSV